MSGSIPCAPLKGESMTGSGAIFKNLFIPARYMILYLPLLLSGCCELIATFTDGECINSQKFNDLYIDQESKLQREKFEREIAQSDKLAPVKPVAAKPDYDWRPWETTKPVKSDLQAK